MKQSLPLLALFLMSASSLAVPQAGSNAPAPLDLTALTNRALADHPRLASALSDIDSARAKRLGLLAPFRPQVSLNAYGATGSGSMIFPGTVEPTNYELLSRDTTGVLNGSVMWRLFTFGREKDLALSGSAAIRASQANLASASLDVDLDVRLAFADALLKRETTLAHHDAHGSALEILRVTQARFDAGKIPEAFVLRAKAAESASEGEVAMAEADEAGSIAVLWDAAGMDQSSAHVLGAWDAALTSPASLADALNFATLHRPELIAIAEQKKQMEAVASAAGKSGLPELSLLGMNDWSGSRGAAGASTYKAGLVLSFPLGDGGQRRADKQEASAAVTKAEAEVRLARNRIQSEVVSAWARWQAVAKISAAAKDEVASGEESFRVALLRYQEGKAIFAELADSRSELTHANLALAEANAYARKAWSKLQRAIGGNPAP